MRVVRAALAIAVLLGLLAVRPLEAAQPASRLPRIGFLSGAMSRPESERLLDAFRRGPGDLGYVEGRNIAIEYRWADFQYERLPRLAADLVERTVDVIFAANAPDPQGHEGGRAAGRAADEVRARHQHETAKALGPSIPPSVMLRADHGIQP